MVAASKSTCATPCYAEACGLRDKSRQHVNHWAYAADNEDDSKLLEMLGGPRTPPGLYDMGTPAKSAAMPIPEGGPLAVWLRERGLPDLLGPLWAAEVRSLADLGGLVDEDLSAFFAAEPATPIGLRGRLRTAVRELRMES